MIEPFVICDHQVIEASLVPTECYASPGLCPAGIYDTLLGDGLQIRNRNLHLARFIKNCQLAGLNSGYDSDSLDSLLSELIKANNINGLKCRIRIMAFGNIQPMAGGKSFSSLAVAWKIDSSTKPNPHFRCAISERRRSSSDSRFQLKRLGMDFVDTDLEGGRKKDFSDILYMNEREEFCEASYSNFWVYTNGVLRTPPVSSPCLPGIVRDRVLNLAHEACIPVRDDQPIDSNCVSNASEIFLSSSVRGIQPVTEIPSLSWQTDPGLNSVSEKLIRIMNL